MLSKARFDQILVNKAVAQYNLLLVPEYRQLEIGDVVALLQDDAGLAERLIFHVFGQMGGPLNVEPWDGPLPEEALPVMAALEGLTRATTTPLWSAGRWRR